MLFQAGVAPSVSAAALLPEGHRRDADQFRIDQSRQPPTQWTRPMMMIGSFGEAMGLGLRHWWSPAGVVALEVDTSIEHERALDVVLRIGHAAYLNDVENEHLSTRSYFPVK
ncbi:hypothetical protein BE73_14260 [Xanthomonas oryzae pv. oryzicola]|nr:hypothetical protein BE73_14260 [Xanthomonas oryzae pv. oryzicola]